MRFVLDRILGGCQKRAKRLLPTAAAYLSLMLSAGALADGVVHPPWIQAPLRGENFTVPGIDNVPDLYGDINDPHLVVFFGGNQYMVVRDLVQAFQAAHPEYQRIFIETLPPGILLRQIEQGALVIGNMRISLQPDVYAAGRSRIEELQREKHWFARTANYAANRLAILTALGNPQNIVSWADLARPGLTLCMPNPQTEGIAENAIIPALRAAGGDELVDRVYKQKVRNGETFLTQIHHRQTPMRIMEGKCEAGVVWYTEGYFHSSLTPHPISMVMLSDAQNHTGSYSAGVLKTAPHPKAGEDFLQFLQSKEGQAVYQKYGFLAPGK
jgi:molybdate transport system substrate-binding protein